MSLRTDQIEAVLDNIERDIDLVDDALRSEITRFLNQVIMKKTADFAPSMYMSSSVENAEDEDAEDEGLDKDSISKAARLRVLLGLRGVDEAVLLEILSNNVGECLAYIKRHESFNPPSSNITPTPTSAEANETSALDIESITPIRQAALEQLLLRRISSSTDKVNEFFSEDQGIEDQGINDKFYNLLSAPGCQIDKSGLDLLKFNQILNPFVAIQDKVKNENMFRALDTLVKTNELAEFLVILRESFSYNADANNRITFPQMKAIKVFAGMHIEKIQAMEAQISSSEDTVLRAIISDAPNEILTAEKSNIHKEILKEKARAQLNENIRSEVTNVNMLDLPELVNLIEKH